MSDEWILGFAISIVGLIVGAWEVFGQRGRRPLIPPERQREIREQVERDLGDYTLDDDMPWRPGGES